MGILLSTRLVFSTSKLRLLLINSQIYKNMKSICSLIFRLLILVCVLFSGVFTFNNWSFAKENQPNEQANFFNNYDSDERKIHDLINQERKKYRLDSLDWDSDLADLARSYSKKMAKENFFSHYERDGRMVADRARAMKITGWKRIGENLFMSENYEKIAQLAVKEWMRSPSHRQNILDGRYNETGIGIAKSKNGTIYITQVFLQK